MAGSVRRLLLTPFISDDALLRKLRFSGLRQAGLTAVLPTHVLFAFEIVFLRYDHRVSVSIPSTTRRGGGSVPDLNDGDCAMELRDHCRIGGVDW
jgi:hypothetical protein